MVDWCGLLVRKIFARLRSQIFSSLALGKGCVRRGDQIRKARPLRQRDYWDWEAKPWDVCGDCECVTLRTCGDGKGAL